MIDDIITEMRAADAMTEKPIRFTVGKKRLMLRPPFYGRKTYEVKPPTLGKMQVLSKCYLSLEIDGKALADDPHVEAMRVCETKSNEVCWLMAVAVSNGKKVLDDRHLAKLAEYFRWHAKAQDFATVVLAILTQIDYVNFITSIRLTAMFRQNKPNEQVRAARVE